MYNHYPFAQLEVAVLANASMAVVLSAPTPMVQFSVYQVSASWRSELG